MLRMVTAFITSACVLNSLPSSNNRTHRVGAFGFRRYEEKELVCFSFEDSWSEMDPEAKFLVHANGRVASHNASAGHALDAGLVSVDSLGVLHFGSANSDSFFLSALDTVKPDKFWRERLVLRGRDGGWLGASLFRLRDEPMSILSFRAETSPPREAFVALAAAFHLTQAEQEVLCGLMAGRCPKEIAVKLDISEHTVRAHLRQIYTKMEVRGLSGTIRRAALLT